MLNFRFFISFLLVITVGCKTMGQMAHQEGIELQEAVWYRWTGGQPGVKGFYFKFKLLVGDATFEGDPEIFVNDIKIGTEEVVLAEDYAIVYGYYLSPRKEKQVNMTEEDSIKSIEVPHSGEIIFNLDGILNRIKIPEFKEEKFERK